MNYAFAIKHINHATALCGELAEIPIRSPLLRTIPFLGVRFCVKHPRLLGEVAMRRTQDYSRLGANKTLTLANPLLATHLRGYSQPFHPCCYLF